jgi:ribosomal protein L7/L12
MKSIREAQTFVTILNLIQDRSREILCDIVDALIFNRESVQSVLNRWGIKLNAEAPAMAPNSVTINHGGLAFNMTIVQYSQVVRLIYSGQWIEGIKAIRAATNSGLKEAKDLAEYIRDNK